MGLSYERKEKIIAYLRTVFHEEKKLNHTLGGLIRDDSVFDHLCLAKSDEEAIDYIKGIINNNL